MSEVKEPIALIGAGNVGKTLGRRWNELGLRIGWVSCRSHESAMAATRFIGAGIPTDEPERAIAGAGLIVLAVPDSVIAETAGKLAKLRTLPSQAVACHLSGALSSDILEPLRQRGLAVGTFHPLQTFADPAQATGSLEGITYGVEGDAEAVEVLEPLAVMLGGRVLRLLPQQKVLYHAAAAIASNYTVALTAVATKILESIGAEPQAALAALLPLIRGTVANLKEVGLPAALTGPIARGDREVVSAHRDALAELDPPYAQLYCLLGRETARVALAKGSLSEEGLREMEKVLE